MTPKTQLLRRARLRGVTLIELMIAMVLGLLIVAAAGAVYVSSKQAFRANDNLARVQENVRAAFDIISRDIRQTAFFGCAGQDVKLTNNLSNNTRLLWNFSVPVFGYEASSLSAWHTTPDAAIISPLAGRDILAIHTIDEGGGPVVAQDVANSRISVSQGSGIVAGDLLIANNCQTATVFQATAVAQNAGLDVVTHGTTGSLTPGNSRAAIDGPFANGGELRRLATRVYYIAINPAGLPTLFVQSSGGGAAQEIAEGVEDMQVSYGIDDNADFGVDRYVVAQNETSTPPTFWPNVVSVQIVLNYISPEDFVATTEQSDALNTKKDRRMRRQITTTIALRNRAG
jgi:type IV pilus assembly protein PilW